MNMTGYVLFWYLLGVKLTWGHAHKTGSWYLLGVTFKKSDEHPRHFPSPPGNRLYAILIIIIKNNIIIIIRTFPESFSPEKFILGNKFVNFKRSNLLRSRSMSTNHEIPLILNLVWWRHQSRDYAQKRLFSLLWKQIFMKSQKRNVVRSTLLLVI